MVLFIHRPALLGLSEDSIDRAELIIAKNRAGEMGIIPLRFNGDQVRFTEDTMTLVDYAAMGQKESSMNADDITPKLTEGYSPFNHFESRKNDWLSIISTNFHCQKKTETVRNNTNTLYDLMVIRRLYYSYSLYWGV